MKNIGFNPEFMLLTSQFFSPDTVKSAKSVSYPPTYAALGHLPFELSAQYPVMALAKSIVTAAAPHTALGDFTAAAFSAWTLWAKSATACGSDLTVTCVLQKGGSETVWTAGGMFPPVVTAPGNQKLSPCLLEMRLTTNGWVYDKAVTNPDKGSVYNCNPKNLTSS